MTRPARIALYGAGMISRAHGAAAQVAGMSVVAVASRSRERAAERAADLGGAAMTYDEVIASRPADIVAVSTPPQCHAADAIRLLHTGVAVLLEKPLCTTLADADAIVAAAESNGQRLLYAENLAYAPVVQQLLVHTPELGALRHLEVRSLQSLPTWGAFTTDEWGGGALFDLGVHPLAVALLAANAAGCGAPVAVQARLERGEGHGTDEHAEVLLEYASGLVARVESSWRHGPQPVWDAQLASDTGVLRAELMPRPRLERNGDEIPLPPARTAVPILDDAGYLGQLVAFANDVAAGATPVMSAAFGRFVLDVVCAAYRSAGRDGSPERVPFEGDRSRTPLQLWRDG